MGSMVEILQMVKDYTSQGGGQDPGGRAAHSDKVEATAPQQMTEPEVVQTIPDKPLLASKNLAPDDDDALIQELNDPRSSLAQVFAKLEARKNARGPSKPPQQNQINAGMQSDYKGLPYFTPYF